MYVYMPTRTISITEEAYERLKAKKNNNESFSDIILKITGKAMLSDFAGILSKDEADKLEARIKASRANSRSRADRIRKRLSE